jgi:tetratricopeptide (TPR) repeat protein
VIIAAAGVTHDIVVRPVAQDYTWRDVDRLLGLSRHVVTRLIAAGFLSPGRGSRNEYRFSFHDLVVLRAAHALVAAKIPTRRIVKALRALRAKLPVEVPLAGISIQAVGEDVVVREGAAQWVPSDGQYLLQFEVGAQDGQLVFLGGKERGSATPDVDWFARAVELEEADPHAAMDAYRKSVDANPAHCDTYVNLGYLLHQEGDLEAASATYRAAIANCEPSGLLLFNLAVVEEDLGQTEAAARHYLDALGVDPALADAHHNLARLYERSGAQKEALRHWSAYRKLTR